LCWGEIDPSVALARWLNHATEVGVRTGTNACATD
jgi:hypothetical protein